MCTVYIGIGHDNDLVIPQFADIEIIMDSGSECGDHRFDLCIGVDSIQSRLLHIQNLSTKRKNGLCCTVTGCLCRSSRRVSLYDVDLAVCRIFIGTVCQFSRKRHGLQGGFSSGQISCLSCSFPCTLCHHRLIDDHLCHRRILLQENLKLCADDIVNRTSCLTVSQLLFGLSFKLRILDLDTDDCGQTLSDILSGQICLIIF